MYLLLKIILNETYPALGRVGYLLPKIILNDTSPGLWLGDVSTIKNSF